MTLPRRIRHARFRRHALLSPLRARPSAGAEISAEFDFFPSSALRPSRTKLVDRSPKYSYTEYSPDNRLYRIIPVAASDTRDEQNKCRHELFRRGSVVKAHTCLRASNDAFLLQEVRISFVYSYGILSSNPRSVSRGASARARAVVIFPLHPRDESRCLRSSGCRFERNV